jgi:hypothetical protein
MSEEELRAAQARLREQDGINALHAETRRRSKPLSIPSDQPVWEIADLIRVGHMAWIDDEGCAPLGYSYPHLYQAFQPIHEMYEEMQREELGYPSLDAVLDSHDRLFRLCRRTEEDFEVLGSPSELYERAWGSS